LKCNSRPDGLTVYYKTAANDEADALRESKTEREWDPWELVTEVKDDRWITGVKTIVQHCKAPEGTYEVRISPQPGNFNIQGERGACMTAMVEILRNGTPILPKRTIGGDCHDYSAPELVKVEVVGHETPKLTFLGNDQARINAEAPNKSLERTRER
jgi:hypothetical protein